MRHLNKDLMCALAILTTGPDPKRDSIVHFCLAPLDWTLQTHKSILPFMAHMEMRRSGMDKDWIGREKIKIIESLKKGIDPYRVADTLEAWKDKFIGQTKRIVPLCYNWPFIRPFLEDWLGIETTKYIFQDKVRDLLVIANYLNDRADTKLMGLPYPKPEDFTYLAQTCDADYKQTMDCGKECLALIKMYDHMLRDNI